MASTPVSNKISVFVDSTVLMSASVSGTGASRDVLDHALASRIDAYISSDVLDETERNIKLKRPQALASFHAYRDQLSSKIIDPAFDTINEVSRTVELKDAPIVAAAFEANALYLVTYDEKHLLSKRDAIWDTFGVMVVTPIEVLYLLPVEQDESE